MKYLVAFFLILVLAIGIWQYKSMAPPAHEVIGVDNSLSIRPDCAGLVATSRVVTHADEFTQGSTVTLLIIGKSARQPWSERAFDKPLPVASDTVLSRNEAVQTAARETYFASLRAACETAAPSHSSPILQLVRDGIGHLRSRGCAPRGQCYLTIETDLREDVDPALRDLIQRLASNPNAATPPTLRRSVNNDGIAVRFCGMSRAQAIGRGREVTTDTLQHIWTGIFTDPNVTFAPFCGSK